MTPKPSSSQGHLPFQRPQPSDESPAAKLALALDLIEQGRQCSLARAGQRRASDALKVVVRAEAAMIANRERLRRLLLRFPHEDFGRAILLAYEELACELIGTAPAMCLELAASGPYRAAKLALLRRAATEFKPLQLDADAGLAPEQHNPALFGLLALIELHLAARSFPEWAAETAPRGLTALIRRSVDRAFAEPRPLAADALDAAASGTAASGTAASGAAIEALADRAAVEPATGIGHASREQLRAFAQRALPGRSREEDELLFSCWIEYTTRRSAGWTIDDAVDALLASRWQPAPVRHGVRRGMEPTRHQLRQRVYDLFERITKVLHDAGQGHVRHLIFGRDGEGEAPQILRGGE